MSGKNILVIGHAGYIGNALTQKLLMSGYSVSGVDNFSCEQYLSDINSISALPELNRYNKLKRFNMLGRFKEYDIDVVYNYSDIYYLLRHQKFDTIVNLGHIPSAPYSMQNVMKSNEVLTNNVIGTNILLWGIKDICPNTHYLTVGSTGEYSHNLNVDIEEGNFTFEHKGRTSTECLFPRKANSIYHASKISSTYMIDYLSKMWNLKCSDLMQAVVFGSYTDELDETEIYSRLSSDECFIGRTDVMTPSGYKQIRDITKGDLVYTHLGNIKTVNKTMKRQYRGIGYKISLPYGIEFTSTENHPFYVYIRQNYKNNKLDNINWVSANDIYETSVLPKYPDNKDTFDAYDTVISKHKEGIPYYIISKETGVSYNCVRRWSNGAKPRKIIRTNTTTNNDIFFTIPRLKYITNDLVINVYSEIDYGIIKNNKVYCCNSMSDNHIHDGSKGIPNIISVDGDFCRLAGYYLAEGSISEYQINFAFDKNETVFIEDVRRILLEKFNVITTVYESKGSDGVNILGSSKILCMLFIKLFGKGCREKFIREDFMNLPDNTINELINGYWRGDGCGRTERNICNISSVSSSILKQIQYLLLRQGIISAVRFRERTQTMSFKGREKYSLDTNTFDLYVTGEACRRFFEKVCGLEPNNKKHKSDRIYSNDEYIFIPLKKIEKVNIDEYVYNMEIEDDESYLVPISAHNCYGTAINRFIVQACIGEPLTIYGDGKHQRGFISLNDSIQALMLAIENPAEEGIVQTWNQLSEWHSINDIAKMVVDVGSKLGLTVERQNIPTPRQEYTGDHYYNYVCEKLPALGYKPTRTINDEIEYTMKKVLTNLEKNPNIIPMLKNIVIPKIKF